MKKGLLKISLGLSLLLGSYISVAQPAVQPLSFGFVNGQTITNYYKDYVGERFAITYPPSIAGEKLHSTAPADNVAGTTWTDITPGQTFTNVQIIKGVPDSTACTALQNGTAPYPSMSGKIAFVYRGNCYFSDKAQAAQNAGAVACIIVNDQPNGVVGMAAASNASSIHIAVYMISEADGAAIDNLLNQGDSITLSVTPWGFGFPNDLGFVFDGGSVWHDYAIPNYELGSSNGSPAPFKQIDGAFVANFGTQTQHEVQLNSTLQFTPSGSSTATVVRKDSTSIDSFPAQDSIVVMYMTGSPSSGYNMQNGGNGNGRYDIIYNVKSDSTDQFPQDNTETSSFYTTDSLYAKGAYDFTNNMPLSSIYINGFTSNGEALAGPMYYVSSGGHNAASTQFSTILIPAAPALPGGILPTDAFPIYLFHWQDSNTTTFYHDSLIESGELQEPAALIGIAQYTFNGTTDSSWETFSVPFQSYPQTTPATTPALAANSWYWICADMPQSYAIGYDGITNYYPRSYGVFNYLQNKEYWMAIDSGGLSFLLSQEAPNDLFDPFPFGGSYSVDSVYFSSEKQCFAPSMPLITTTSTMSTAGVQSIAQADLKINVFPNPTTDLLNVTVDLPCVAKSIFYDVISTVGVKVTSASHHNLQNDKFVLDTRNLAPGRYYVTVIADNSMVTREFNVLKH